MNSRIEELINFTKLKFDLDNYYLQRQEIYRNINIFNDTVYTLCMEWFPNHVTEQKNDESNPEGTAVIEINMNTRKFESAIFVMDKTYAKDGVMFTSLNDIIKWAEYETGLTYEKEFQFYKEDEGEFHFIQCIHVIAISPSNFIEIHINQEGNLTFFSFHTHSPSKEIVKKETYKLSFETLDHVAKKRVKLVEFPSYEQKRSFQYMC